MCLRKYIHLLFKQSSTVFLEQPLALPGSANKYNREKDSSFAHQMCNSDVFSFSSITFEQCKCKYIDRYDRYGRFNLGQKIMSLSVGGGYNLSQIFPIIIYLKLLENVAHKDGDIYYPTQIIPVPQSTNLKRNVSLN